MDKGYANQKSDRDARYAYKWHNYIQVREHRLLANVEDVEAHTNIRCKAVANELKTQKPRKRENRKPNQKTWEKKKKVN